MKLNENKPAEQSAGFQQNFKEIRLTITAASEIRSFFDEYKAQSNSHEGDCLMLVDADDTLVRLRSFRGSSPWFFEAARYLCDKKNILKPEAFRALEILANTYLIKNAEEDFFEVAESEWPEIIEHFHSHQIPVVVVTGRTAAVAHVSARSLKKLGFIFSHDYFGGDEVVLLPLDNVRHHEGTLHCGAQPKGDVVAHFMKQRHQITPFKRRIDVFLIDDREHYLDQLSRGLESLANELQADITYYRVHYVRPLEHPEGYHLSEEEIAAIEHTYACFIEKK